MKPLVICLLLVCLAACKKDDKTCSIAEINGNTYIGQIGVCASSSQFLEFAGAATLTLQDSIYMIELSSMDSLHAFLQFFQASCTCEVLDDDTNWTLVDINSQYALGSIYGDGKFLLLDLRKGTCNEDQFFLGALEE